VHVDVGADTGTEAVDGSGVIGAAVVSSAVMGMIEPNMMTDVK